MRANFSENSDSLAHYTSEQQTTLLNNQQVQQTRAAMIPERTQQKPTASQIQISINALLGELSDIKAENGIMEEVSEHQINQESSYCYGVDRLLSNGGDQSSLLIVQDGPSLAEGEADSDIAYQNFEQLVEADDCILDDLTLNRGLTQGMGQLQIEDRSIILQETTHLSAAEESLISLQSKENFSRHIARMNSL